MTPLDQGIDKIDEAMAPQLAALPDAAKPCEWTNDAAANDPSLLLPREDTAFELRFPSLHDQSRGYAFPCDACGCVDLDALSAIARLNYIYARALVGREFGLPDVHLTVKAVLHCPL